MSIPNSLSPTSLRFVALHIVAVPAATRLALALPVAAFVASPHPQSGSLPDRDINCKALPLRGNASIAV